MKRSDLGYVQYCLGVVCFLIGSIFVGCESEYSTPSNTNALVFSSDTISFDTLFVGDRSETYALKLYNKSDKNVRIDQILLEGGEDSPYSVNIDGNAQHAISDVEIAAKDSLYIFIEINCPEFSEAYRNITDKITLRVGNLTKNSIIQTYVQNVNILNNMTIEHNTTLNSTLPYRILGELKVADNATLTITPGTKLYMAQGARIEVFGSIVASGEPDKRITIHSDRLTSFYDDVPAQWDYLCINKSANAYLRCVDISNARYALQADSTATVNIDGSTLRDASVNLILSRFADISVLNSLLYNCGKAIIEDQASNIDIIHSTISNHFTWEYRNTPALNLLPCDTIYGNILIANSIIEGNLKNELECKSDKLIVENCAITVEKNNILENDPRYQNCISTRKINFVNLKEHDYHLSASSEAIGMGDSKYSDICPYDFEGVLRDTSAPTIGVYEAPTSDDENE